jgi:hypothetical protein
MLCFECLPSSFGLRSLGGEGLLLLLGRCCLRRVPKCHSGNKKVQKAEPFCPLFCFTLKIENFKVFIFAVKQKKSKLSL